MPNGDHTLGQSAPARPRLGARVFSKASRVTYEIQQQAGDERHSVRYPKPQDLNTNCVCSPCARTLTLSQTHSLLPLNCVNFKYLGTAHGVLFTKAAERDASKSGFASISPYLTLYLSRTVLIYK
jgi:hypothetical protein